MLAWQSVIFFAPWQSSLKVTFDHKYSLGYSIISSLFEYPLTSKLKTALWRSLKTKFFFRLGSFIPHDDHILSELWATCCSSLNYTYKACFLDFTMISLFVITYKAPQLNSNPPTNKLSFMICLFKPVGVEILPITSGILSSNPFLRQ